MIQVELHKGDCLELLKGIPTASVDLVVTDPPYQIDNTKAGGNSKLCKRIQSYQDELTGGSLTDGFNLAVLGELLRVMKVPNLYIWCNGRQVPMYLDYFVKERGLSFDILIWAKTNAPPTFNNKYLTDKEYCLYFRGGGTANLLIMSTLRQFLCNLSTARIRGFSDIRPSSPSTSFRRLYSTAPERERPSWTVLWEAEPRALPVQS